MDGFSQVLEGFQNHFLCDSWAVGFFGGPTILTTMTEEDWTIASKALARKSVPCSAQYRLTLRRSNVAAHTCPQRPRSVAGVFVFAD